MKSKIYIELKAYRIRCGLNQKTVGNMIGVTCYSYSHKENGKTPFSLEEAFKITERFNSILKKKGLETVSIEKLFAN